MPWRHHVLPPTPGTPQQIPQAFWHWANIMTGLLLHSPRRALSSQSSRPSWHSATLWYRECVPGCKVRLFQEVWSRYTEVQSGFAAIKCVPINNLSVTYITGAGSGWMVTYNENIINETNLLTSTIRKNKNTFISKIGRITAATLHDKPFHFFKTKIKLSYRHYAFYFNRQLVPNMFTSYSTEFNNKCSCWFRLGHSRFFMWPKRQLIRAEHIIILHIWIVLIIYERIPFYQWWLTQIRPLTYIYMIISVVSCVM